MVTLPPFGGVTRIRGNSSPRWACPCGGRTEPHHQRNQPSESHRPARDYCPPPGAPCRYWSTSELAPARRLHNMLAAYEDPLGALLKDDEFERFGYFCDFDHTSQNVQTWIERFDLGVWPLLRRS